MYALYMKKNTKQTIIIGLRATSLMATYKLAKKSIASLAILKNFFLKQPIKAVVSPLKDPCCHHNIYCFLKSNKLLTAPVSKNFILTKPLIKHSKGPYTL